MTFWPYIDRYVEISTWTSSLVQCPVSPPQQTVQVAAAGGGTADTAQLTRGAAEECSTRAAAEERTSCGGWASCNTATSSLLLP